MKNEDFVYAIGRGPLTTYYLKHRLYKAASHHIRALGSPSISAIEYGHAAMWQLDISINMWLIR